MDMNLLLFALLAVIAEILGTIGGFGSSLFFVPLASFFFDMKTVLGITAVFHVFSNLSKLAMFYRHINWTITLQMGIPAVIMVIIGAWLTTRISFRYDQVALGIFLLGFSIWMLAKPDFQLKTSLGSIATGGAVSGFLAGFVGTGGAIRGLALAAFNLPKDIFIGTSAAIDMGVDVSRAIIYSESGYINQSHFLLIGVLLVVSVVGSYSGKLLLEKIPQQNFKTLVLSMIGIVGFVMLTRSIIAL